MLVWFSAALNVDDEVKTGALSLRLLIFILTSCSEFDIEPEAVITIEKVDLFSKSGAELKVNTPNVGLMLIESASVPDKEYVTSPPTGSSAITSPISV